MRLPKAGFVLFIFDEASFVVKRACRSHASAMSQDLKSALAARIRAARLRRKMTQEDLAAQVERTPESISNIERGLQLPSIETMLEICRILGIPIADMFEGIGHASRKSRKRFQMEAQLQQVGQQLSDRDLRIAIDQANVLLTMK